jgi:hypothetical protein
MPTIQTNQYKVAVLMTGQLRTITKTLIYFKQNVLLNECVHVFLCVQNDTNETNLHWENTFSNELGSHLKAVQWFNLCDETFLYNREKSLNVMNIDENWKNYLRTSGSMVEYYQLHLANLEMCKYENNSGCTYDYVVRYRTDFVLSSKLDFQWNCFTPDDIFQRLRCIETHLIEKNVISENIALLKKSKLFTFNEFTESEEVQYENYKHILFKYFMGTILFPIQKLDFYENDLNMRTLVMHLNDKLNAIKMNDIADFVYFIMGYIQSARYILTCRTNLFYVVKRSFFSLLPSLSFLYGTLRSDYEDDKTYWFNAENQFLSVCCYSHLNIHNLSCYTNEHSLYHYIKDDYLDDDLNIKPSVYYFLMRS